MLSLREAASPPCFADQFHERRGATGGLKNPAASCAPPWGGRYVPENDQSAPIIMASPFLCMCLRLVDCCVCACVYVLCVLLFFAVALGYSHSDLELKR